MSLPRGGVFSQSGFAVPPAALQESRPLEAFQLTDVRDVVSTESAGLPGCSRARLVLFLFSFLRPGAQLGRPHLSELELERP